VRPPQPLTAIAATIDSRAGARTRLFLRRQRPRRRRAADEPHEGRHEAATIVDAQAVEHENGAALIGRGWTAMEEKRANRIRFRR